MKIGMISLGCAKNRVDSEEMLGHLLDAGHKVTARPEDADVLIVNTCGFIREARQESIEAILDAARYKRPEKGRCQLLLVVGCLAQIWADELLKEVQEIDGIMGASTPSLIVHLLNAAKSGQRRLPASSAQTTGVHPGGYHPEAPIPPRVLSTPPYTAYVKVSEGCDNRCNYCAIPSIRGPLRSRPPHEIVAEVCDLVRRGVREIALVAQDLTAYGMDLASGAAAPARSERLVELLEHLAQVPDLRWIRLLYLHPAGITSGLISAIANIETVCEYVDVPLQHASGRVLKMMGRWGSPEAYLHIIEALRAEVPGISIRSTFLVGHPGEGPREFEELLAFLEKAELDYAGFFAYSPERGTRSFTMRDRPSRKEARRRRDVAASAQRRISRRAAARRVGTEVEVVVEGVLGQEKGGSGVFGRHRGQAPEVDGITLIPGSTFPSGTFLKALVVGSQGHDLVVSPVSLPGIT